MSSKETLDNSNEMACEVERLQRENARLDTLATDWGNKCDEWQETLGFQCPSAAKAEMERLQSIVSKVPKTADGVQIVPGMRVWFRSWDTDDIRSGITKRVDWSLSEAMVNMDNAFTRWSQELYSTREACKVNMT